MAIKKTLWGNYNQQDVHLFTISNNYMELSVSNFGCTIVSIMMPADKGGFDNVVLGYDSLKGYIDDPYYMGSIVGRYANRISNASFKIGEKEYLLAANETVTGNHLHGGTIGFNKKVFAVSNEAFPPAYNAIQFHYASRDGEEGYPGNLEVFISYKLTDNNEIIISYKASTDKTTPVNLTSHCYFNLSGSKTTGTDQELFINADNVLIADENYIPNGEIKRLKETNLDFTSHRFINNDNQNNFTGYNDCFVLNEPDNENDIKAILTDRGSGRKMIVKTTLPGIMLYTGDYLAAPFKKNLGVCLEAQFFPDSPNQHHFPSTLLRPGEQYQHITIYQFN